MSLVVDSKRVLSAFIRVLPEIAGDIFRLGSKRARAEKKIRVIGKVRAIAIIGMTRGEGVEFSRTKNKEKGAMEKEGGSLAKEVLFCKSALLNIIRLSVSVLRLI